MKQLNTVLQAILNNPQIQNNPIAMNALQMYRAGDSQGLQKMAENICKERGTTTNEIKNAIMQRFS